MTRRKRRRDVRTVSYTTLSQRSSPCPHLHRLEDGLARVRAVVAGLAVDEDGLQSDAKGSEYRNVADGGLAYGGREEVPGDEEGVHQPSVGADNDNLSLSLLAVVHLNVVETDREEQEAR